MTFPYERAILELDLKQQTKVLDNVLLDSDRVVVARACCCYSIAECLLALAWLVVSLPDCGSLGVPAYCRL